MQYSKQEILEIINHQLLLWIKKDKAVKNAVFELVQTKHPTKKETDDKFDKMLKLFRQELANDREIQEKKWEAQEKKWDENQDVIRKMLANIDDLNTKYIVNIGAIDHKDGAWLLKHLSAMHSRQSLKNRFLLK